MKQNIKELRSFLKENFYTTTPIARMDMKSQRLVEELFGLFMENPKLLPMDIRKKLSAKSKDKELAETICDYIANMTDIMAAIGLAQLNRYEALLARRREIIGKYDAAIRGVLADALVHYGDDFASSGHLYATRVYGIDEKQRNAIITAMAEMGVATNVHYKPLPMHTAYKNLGFDIKDFPVSYGKYANEITLPLHTLLGDDDVEYVTECFRKAVKEIRK